MTTLRSSVVSYNITTKKSKETKMSNYKIVSTKSEPRVELKEALNLSGCELSINELPANASVPPPFSTK